MLILPLRIKTNLSVTVMCTHKIHQEESKWPSQWNIWLHAVRLIPYNRCNWLISCYFEMVLWSYKHLSLLTVSSASPCGAELCSHGQSSVGGWQPWGEHLNMIWWAPGHSSTSSWPTSRPRSWGSTGTSEETSSPTKVSYWGLSPQYQHRSRNFI